MGALVFLSHSGPRALAELRAALARHELEPRDLLRLRLFACSPQHAAGMRRDLEELLPRSQWPAVTNVTLAGRAPLGQVVDAIAARGARESRMLVEPGTAVRFADWTFVGSLTGAHRAERDLANGAECGPAKPAGDELAERDPADGIDCALAERIERQAGATFDRMQATLRSAGVELRDVVKVAGWLKFPMTQYAPLARVRSRLAERSQLLPASSAVQVGDTPADVGGQLLSFEAVAFAGLQTAPPAVASSLATYYAAARSAGGYVFAAGEIARPVERTGALAEASAQVDDIYEQLRQHVSAYGASLRDIVHQTVYVRNAEHLPAIERRIGAWLHARPPTTMLHVIDMGFRKGADVEIELVVDAR